MARAHITTAEGTRITIEGAPAEVAAIVKQVGIGVPPTGPRGHVSRESRKVRTKEKATPINLVSSLIDGGFFRKPKDLAAVKIALEEMGQYYPVTSLSPTLLRLVRKRQLRRIKDKKRWLYTG